MKHDPLRIALITHYPAKDLVPLQSIKKKYHQGQHPVPWVRSFCNAFASRSDILVGVFVCTRAVRHHVRVEQGNVVFEFIPKYIPDRIEPFDGYIPRFLQLSPYIRPFSPDIVHGFGTESGNGALSTFLPYPNIISIQGIWEKLAPYCKLNKAQNYLKIQAEKWAVRRASGIIAKTNFAKQWVRSINPTIPIALIPNALNPEFLKGFPSFERPHVLCIGAMCQYKGTDVVLRAFSQVSSSKARLRIIGGASVLDHTNYVQLAENLGIRDQVDFLGNLTRKQIIKEMETARLLVLGSRMDTSPNVIIEAHAAGLPVVGTKQGGIPDMIRHGQDGFLVGLDQIDEFARKIECLVNDSSLGRVLGASGRRKVTALHDPLQIAEAHLQFYKKVLAVRKKKL
ncbi:MAG: glycosyltransferase [Kiritimatiellae bacterium]|nr:glycosyltransferase [Kiritimatiellia bacterium]